LYRVEEVKNYFSWHITEEKWELKKLYIESLKGQQAARKREHCGGNERCSRLQILQLEKVLLLLLMRE
jgi:hypothetical protein